MKKLTLITLSLLCVSTFANEQIDQEAFNKCARNIISGYSFPANEEFEKALEDGMKFEDASVLYNDFAQTVGEAVVDFCAGLKSTK